MKTPISQSRAYVHVSAAPQSRPVERRMHVRLVSQIQLPQVRVPRVLIQKYRPCKNANSPGLEIKRRKDVREPAVVHQIQPKLPQLHLPDPSRHPRAKHRPHSRRRRRRGVDKRTQRALPVAPQPADRLNGLGKRVALFHIYIQPGLSADPHKPVADLVEGGDEVNGVAHAGAVPDGVLEDGEAVEGNDALRELREEGEGDGVVGGGRKGEEVLEPGLDGVQAGVEDVEARDVGEVGGDAGIGFGGEGDFLDAELGAVELGDDCVWRAR